MSGGGDYLDETHQRISEFAAEFLDDDEERESFVDGLMERRGYQRATHWTAPEPDPKAKPGLLKQQGANGGQGGTKSQGSYFKR